jgi:hypothetical protein
LRKKMDLWKCILWIIYKKLKVKIQKSKKQYENVVHFQRKVEKQKNSKNYVFFRFLFFEF